jgi:hypothetical protein
MYTYVHCWTRQLKEDGVKEMVQQVILRQMTIRWMMVMAAMF